MGGFFGLSGFYGLARHAECVYRRRAHHA
jgi:hypothetical protein